MHQHAALSDPIDVVAFDFDIVDWLVCFEGRIIHQVGIVPNQERLFGCQNVLQMRRAATG